MISTQRYSQRDTTWPNCHCASSPPWQPSSTSRWSGSARTWSACTSTPARPVRPVGSFPSSEHSSLASRQLENILTCQNICKNVHSSFPKYSDLPQEIHDTIWDIEIGRSEKYVFKIWKISTDLPHVSTRPSCTYVSKATATFNPCSISKFVFLFCLFLKFWFVNLFIY